jgi:hypothetical protein
MNKNIALEYLSSSVSQINTHRLSINRSTKRGKEKSHFDDIVNAKKR